MRIVNNREGLFYMQDDNITIKYYITMDLYSCGMELNDIEQALPFIMVKNSEEYPEGFELSYKEDPEHWIPVKDFWDTCYELYSDEPIDYLELCISRYALEWCANKIRSMK
jgi:hypothetical protein